MSSGGGTDTVKSKSEPWTAAQPYLTDIMSQAKSIYGSGAGREYYPFSTVVPFSNQSEQALTNIEALAGQTPGYMDAANNTLEKTLNGDFLNANPYLDGIFNNAANKIEDRLNQSAAMRGRTGSGVHQQLLTENLGQLHNDIYGSNYQQERDRMQGSIVAAPALDAQRYAGADRLASVGAARENQAQAQIQDAMNRWDFQNNAMWDLLNKYNATVQGFGGLGGTQTSTQPSSGGGLGGAIGGGLAGAGVAGSLALSNPATAGLAALGALGGLFG